jgi:hypothetical protein
MVSFAVWVQCDRHRTRKCLSHFAKAVAKSKAEFEAMSKRAFGNHTGSFCGRCGSLVRALVSL